MALHLRGLLSLRPLLHVRPRLSPSLPLSLSLSPASRPLSLSLSLSLSLRRSLSLSLFSRESSITSKLREAANRLPENAELQYKYLRHLGRMRPAEVLERVESGVFAADERVWSEYLRCARRLGRQDAIARGESEVSNLSLSLSPSSSTSTSTSTAAGNSAGGGRIPVEGYEAAEIGGGYGQPPRQSPYRLVEIDSSSASPIVVTTSVSGWQEFWKFIRGIFGTAITAVIVVSAASVLMGGEGRPGGLIGGSSTPKPVQTPAGQKKITLNDVKGCDEVKDEVNEIVEFLRDPKKFTRLGGRMPKGVLLVGPPGTGKTLLAKAIAGEANVPFFYMGGSEFDELFVGVGARRARDLFKAAKENAPCVIFIDEIDAVGSKRNPRDQAHMRQTINQILAEMDGFESAQGVIVIGATNFADSLDPALLRPGRFDRHVNVPLPDMRGRLEILLHYAKDKPLSAGVDLKRVARGTPGMCGADLENLLNTAAVRASVLGMREINAEVIDWARDRVMMGAERRSHVMTEKERRLTAFHEGGHAIVALHTTGAREVLKATILPRGQALGMVQQLPAGDEDSHTKESLYAMLDVCMGGRVAEEMIFGENQVTTGASSDFQQATNIARSMVTRFGMSEKIGAMYCEGDKSTAPLYAKAVEEEISRILKESYARTKSLLKSKEKELHTLSEALLEHETLSGKEISILLQTGKVVKDEPGSAFGKAA